MNSLVGGLTQSHEPAANPSDRHRAFVAFVSRPAARTGALAGLTFAAKDCLDIAGRAPGCGIAASGEGAAPREDATIIRTLCDAGAALVGMTQMTPLAFEPSGDNPGLGRPLNPCNPDRVCGGSSSGSAVAVATGQVDFAIGTDTAGSIRIPAHCCGIAGWKPSNGLISTAGVMPLAASLDCVGFLAPGMATIKRLAAVCGARSEGSFSSIAIGQDAVTEAAPAIRETMARLRQIVADRADLPLRETKVLPLLQACDGPVFTLLQGEACQAHEARLRAGTLEPSLAKRLAKGSAITDADLVAARGRLADLAGSALDAVLAPDQVLILPGMPQETPSVAQCDPTSAGFSPRTLYGLSAYTRFANGLGLPVVSIPAGVDGHGMPIGIQLIARRGRDGDLIAFAGLLADALATRSETSSAATGPLP